jgi:hypothetical protein
VARCRRLPACCLVAGVARSRGRNMS